MNISALTQAMLQTGTIPHPAPGRDAGGGSFLDQVNKGLALSGAREAAPVETKSLEDRLKARYPGLAYHVFDGSSRYWQTRQDFPFHKIYQQDTDPSEIEGWRPSGPNPDPLDATVQRNLGSIPPGSRAVIIHPAVQKRMEEDPAYADEIYNRIEAWFTFDVVRNEAIIPGITTGMSQCVAIGEDGQIANVQSCSSGGRFSESKSGETDDEDDFWTARAKRHALYMQQVVEAQILHKLGISEAFAQLRRADTPRVGRGSGSSGGADTARRLAAMQASQGAIAQTMAMMNGPELRAALGDTVGGVAIDVVFEATREAIANRPVTAFF